MGALRAFAVVGQVEVPTPGALPALDAAQVAVHGVLEVNEMKLVEVLPAAAVAAVASLVLGKGSMCALALGALGAVHL